MDAKPSRVIALDPVANPPAHRIVDLRSGYPANPTPKRSILGRFVFDDSQKRWKKAFEA